MLSWSLDETPFEVISTLDGVSTHSIYKKLYTVKYMSTEPFTCLFRGRNRKKNSYDCLQIQYDRKIGMISQTNML